MKATFWYFDSGATHHITPTTAQLENFIPGNLTPVTGIGTVKLQTPSNDLLLTDVLVVPAATKKLLSVQKLTHDNPVNICFTDSSCYVKDKMTNRVLAHGIPSQGVYQMVSDGGRLAYAYSASASINGGDDEYLKWHYKLGHPSDRVISQVLSDCNLRLSHRKIVCEACQCGKSKFLPFSKSVSHASSPLQLVHMNLWGPSPTVSVHGFRFYILFVDDCTRFTWIYPLKNKGEAGNIFQVFKAYVENKFNSTIKTLRCDNGTEFKPFGPICQQAGIEMQFTCPYTSEQNGRVERKHRHVVEVGLTLLAQANLPLTYWWEAFQTAVYLINRLPTPTLKGSTPLFELLKEKPNYRELQIFGSACYPCLKPYNTHKFEYHSQKCVYLGPSSHQKGHRCLSSTGRSFVSRHVIFDPSNFPCRNGFLNRRSPTTDEYILHFPVSLLQGNHPRATSHSHSQPNSQPNSSEVREVSSNRSDDPTVSLSPAKSMLNNADCENSSPSRAGLVSSSSGSSSVSPNSSDSSSNTAHSTYYGDTFTGWNS